MHVLAFCILFTTLNPDPPHVHCIHLAQTPFIQVIPNMFSFPSHQVLGASFTRTLPLVKQYFNQRVKSKVLRGLWKLGLYPGFTQQSRAWKRTKNELGFRSGTILRFAWLKRFLCLMKMNVTASWAQPLQKWTLHPAKRSQLFWANSLATWTSALTGNVKF